MDTQLIFLVSFPARVVLLIYFQTSYQQLKAKHHDNNNKRNLGYNQCWKLQLMEGLKEIVLKSLNTYIIDDGYYVFVLRNVKMSINFYTDNSK